MSLTDLPVFFLDLQTTGAKPGSSDILEVAWSLSDSEDVHSLISQQAEDRPVPRRILSLTGIESQDLEGATPLPDIFQLLYREIGDRPAVIHFAQFEKPFLKAAQETLNHTAFPIICTHEIAKRLFPNLPARGIKGLAGYLGHSSGEFKRGSSHVEATKIIWRHLSQELEARGISSLSDLQTWLINETPQKRTKYEYPMAKEKRLGLPKVPGVYRYVSQWGEILYVGKATSLHDRVNSYFRGQKGRDSFKLEMLTQAYDLIVTECRTPLESALLETDEIKKHNPRYNISLKAGQRELIFFSRDFKVMSGAASPAHPIGPFSNSLVFDSILKLNESLNSDAQEFNPEMFFEPLDSDLLKNGFTLFCERIGQTSETFKSLRSIFAQGLIFVRNTVEEDPQESEEIQIEDLSDEDVEGEIELTVEDIADKFERHFKRAALNYLRSRKMTKLLNCDIEYSLSSRGKKFKLFFRDGHPFKEPQSLRQSSWQNHSVDTYDRMAVLITELERVRTKKGHVTIS